MITSLAEAVDSEADYEEDCLPGLKEALELFQKCFIIQEQQYAEAREMMAQEPPADNAPIPIVRLNLSRYFLVEFVTTLSSLNCADIL